MESEEKINAITDNGGKSFSTRAVCEYFNENIGDLNGNILYSLLNSDNGNVLRNTLISSINKGLHAKISQKEFDGVITIPEKLSSEQQIHLQNTFDDFEIKFTNRVVNSHGYAAASRRCERQVLLNKLGMKLSITSDRIALKEIGGDIVQSLLSGEKNVHCCSPVLNVYDGTRLCNRVKKAKEQFDNGIVRDNYVKEVLKEYLTNHNLLQHAKYFCFDKSQDCRVKSDALLLLHSNYDISLKELGDAMDNAKALVAYGSFLFSPKILTYDNGNIEWINTDFEITRDIFGKRKTIRFSFKDDFGFNYEHDYKKYISYITESLFISSNGSRFSLELLENRDGVQFFRVNRLLFSTNDSPKHRIYLTHLNQKYIVRFPFFHYNKDSMLFQHPGGNATLSPNVLLTNDFWQGLPKNHEWVVLSVDKDVIDKTAAFVLGATEEKFKPEQIVSYLRSITTREVMYTSVASKREIPNMVALAVIAHAIYITLYQMKYVMGKGMQQAIKSTNALREGTYALNTLKEFNRSGWWYSFKRFMSYWRSGSMITDPMRFIVQPAPYLDFVSDLKLGTRLIRDESMEITVNPDDVLVTSDLLAEEGEILNVDQSVEKLVEKDVSPIHRPTVATITEAMVSNGIQPSFKREQIKQSLVEVTSYSKLSHGGVLLAGGLYFSLHSAFKIVANRDIQKELYSMTGALLCLITGGLNIYNQLQDTNSENDSDSCVSAVVKTSPAISSGTADDSATSIISQAKSMIKFAVEEEISEDEGLVTCQEVEFMSASTSVSWQSFDDLCVAKCVDTCWQTESSRDPAPDDESGESIKEPVLYPRLGILDPRSKLIDVDGSRNECTWFAIAEDRSVNIGYLRQLFLSSNGGKISEDLREECRLGKMAGSAVIQAFVNHYGVQVLVDSDYGLIKICPANQEPFRTIKVKLSKFHYYLINSCTENYSVVYRRDKMFEPFNFIGCATYLNSRLPIKCVSGRRGVKTIKSHGNYFVNNLNNYCNIHDECRNNDLRFYMEYLSSNCKYNINLILLFESDNFYMSYYDQLIQSFPMISVRFLCIPYNGYIAAMLYLTSISNNHIVRTGLKEILAHKCDTGKDLMISEKNVLFTCLTDSKKRVIDGLVSNPNFSVIIKRSETREIIDFESPYKIVVNGYGSGPKCDNIVELQHIITRHMTLFSHPVYFVVQIISDFVNIHLISKIFSTCSTMVYIKINSIISYSPALDICYDPSDTQLSLRKNSMREIYAVWYNERSVVEEKLSRGFEVLVSCVTTGVTVNTVIDTTLVLLDLNSGKFIRGTKINMPYSWGYSTHGLINTMDLFNGKELNIASVRSYRKRNIRYLAFSDSSKMVHGITLTQLYSISEIDTLPENPITFVQGVPGAGKTEFILNSNMEETDNLILTVTREAKEDMLRRAKLKNIKLSPSRIRTVDSFLINGGVYSIIKDVWIDEALMLHIGIWSWIMKLTNCARLVVVGDDAQIPYVNRSGLSLAYSLPTDLKVTREYLKVNHRNPLDIVTWLDSTKIYSFDVTGTSDVYYSVAATRISGVDDVPKRQDVKYLTFVQADKSILLSKGYDVNTVNEYQGSQADNVVLVRLQSKESDKIYMNSSYVLVALTRHKKSFHYYTANISDGVSNAINLIKTYTKNMLTARKTDLRGGRELGTDLVEKPDYSITLYLQNRDVRNILLSNEGSGYTPWQFCKEYNHKQDYLAPVLFTSNLHYNVLQEFLDRVLPGASLEFRENDHLIFEYYSETPHIPGVDVRLTAPRFSSYDRLKSHLRTSIQYPLHQSQKLSLKAFLERNGQVPKLQGPIDDYFEAEKLFASFKKLMPKRFAFRKFPIELSYRDLDAWLKGQPPAVIKMINSEEQFSDQKFWLYDFMVKSIPKLDLEIGAEFRYKAPQTITYQTKTINSVFCPLLKELVNRVDYSLYDDVVLYNNMSPQQFADYFSKVLPAERYRVLNKFLEIDFSKYDKSQGLVVLVFECLLMQYFGVSSKHIKIWILMHRITRIVDRNGGFSAFLEYQRKSGDAGTWRFNTLVQLAVLNHVYDLHTLLSSRQCVICLSGDDSVIFTRDEFYRLSEKTFKLQARYNLEAKLLNYNVPYFCSKFLLLTQDGWIFVPDTMKMITKLGRQDLVDFDHVDCYRISFDDNLYYYKFKNYWPYISSAINDRYRVSGEHDLVFETLINISSTVENFRELYYKGVGHVEGKITNKPNLDL